MRSGRYVKQPQGYTAFLPAKLPPEPPIDIQRLGKLLSEADLALGRLDGSTGTLPNPDLFVAMYVRREAVLSSQIEGTQASLTDLLQHEAEEDGNDRTPDIEEVVNYVRAMNRGLERLKEFPLSLRLIREIHAELLKGVRGQEKDPGEFRRSQVWIGPSMGPLSINHATFIPPPPGPDLMEALGDLELFLHDDTMPQLLHAGVVHSQFETIHPFSDGNGRMGRLLVTFLLCQRGVLSQPLLYLSHFLKRNRAEYYDRLQAVRTQGHWEEWLAFFLRGVKEVADEANQTAKKILELRKNHLEVVSKEGKASGNLMRALDLLFERPIVTAQVVMRGLDVSSPTANGIVNRLCELGIVKELTGYKRNRKFAYTHYLDLFSEADSKNYGEVTEGDNKVVDATITAAYD